MPLDTRYIPAFTIQEVLVDKDTAFPLAGGKVYFYEDKARTILKPVCQISGSPPNYSYTVLPNPMILSSIGTFQDNSGNDIVPYFYPFDSNGLVDLYFVDVYSSGDVFQFSREGVPNTTETGEIDIAQLNSFVPNGQFLIHNDYFPPYTQGINVISQDITDIAQGGWTYERSTGSTANDTVSFPRFGSYVTNPTESPRYACKISCISPHVGDAFKGLRLKFIDVNKFASDTQNFTLFFSGINNSGGNQAISINIIKYFGAGGSATTRTNVTTLNVTNTYTNFNVPIIFGSNTGKTIGPNNDDYVQIDISLPAAIPFDLSFTDFSLNRGKIPLQQFPILTNSQFVEKSLAGFIPIPNPDGSDIGLPIRLTPSGFAFDDSMVGKIIYDMKKDPEFGELACNGAILPTNGYSTNGIPYSRLWNKWYQNGNDINGATTSVGMLKSGNNPFVKSQPNLNQPQFTNWQNGAVTAASEGTIPTGFSFSTTQIGTGSLPYIFKLTTVFASAIPPGANFNFHIPTTFGFGTHFVAYYIVDGIGNVPSGTYDYAIAIPIISGYSDATVGDETCYYINRAFFNVPSLGGMFIRIWDNGTGNDPDTATRNPRPDGVAGDRILTNQSSAFATHDHTVAGGGFVLNDPFSKYEAAVGDNSLAAQTTSSAGSSIETRPINVYLNAFVKY